VSGRVEGRRLVARFSSIAMRFFGSTSEESYAESDDASERRVKTPPPSKKASKEKSSKKKKRRDSSARKSSSKKPKKSAPVAVATQAAQSRTFPTPSSVMYAMTAKGKLIQQLLCRWWYVTVWPDPASIPRTAPPNYDRLDGFPGVFICSSGDDIGKMMDFRDKSAAPCFVNMSHRSSEDLKALLLEALEKQEEELLRHEEAENEGMAKIKELRKWAKKVDPDKADREAKKILRAHNMVLAPMLPAVETSNTF